MVQLKLDAETLANFRSKGGQVMLCDEAGNPVQLCDLTPFPDHEPDLSEDEVDRIIAEPGSVTTAELAALLQRLPPS